MHDLNKRDCPKDQNLVPEFRLYYAIGMVRAIVLYKPVRFSKPKPKSKSNNILEKVIRFFFKAYKFT